MFCSKIDLKYLIYYVVGRKTIQNNPDFEKTLIIFNTNFKKAILKPEAM